MSHTNSLIKTKLQIPLVRNDLVIRTRLIDRLLSGYSLPLTLVAAPAGYGKTTLVLHGLAACGFPAAWLSLEKEDDQPDRFFSYLIAALQQIHSDVGDNAAEILATTQPLQIERMITTLINDLAEDGDDLILVLDDYHNVTHPTIHQGITFLLEHCPRRLHLVITTRSDPPLPVVRMQAKNRMVELRADDLRFQIDETTSFLNETMNLGLGLTAIQALEERTEGWIAGLQLAGLSLRDRTDASKFIRDFSGTNRYILDYLLEEVLQNQSSEVQRFLLCTSILESFSAPLCDVLLPEEDTAKASEGAGIIG